MPYSDTLQCEKLGVVYLYVFDTVFTHKTSIQLEVWSCVLSISDGHLVLCITVG